MARPSQWRLFSIREIRLATHNFDADLFLGRGGFGKVYKGLLIDGSRNAISVKRLNSKSRQGAKEFWNEIEMLSNFRHSHLVSLIGYCDEENEMILVYEYMSHGTISDHLYKNSRNGSVAFQPLSWEQRLNICIGAARGLDYLHTGTVLQERVIHRDVKSSNILLDEHWEAKVSDFGLSKIGPANQSCSHVSTNVKGTPGYMDPEYFLTHRLTRKSDVYAFGVVLFEVLCGRRALDLKIDKDQRALAQYAHRCIQEGTIGQIIDSTLRELISKDCLKVFVDIGDQCLHYKQHERPTMADVIAKLEFAMDLQKRAQVSVDYVFSLDTKRFLGNQEHNDIAGVLENLDDGLILCSQQDVTAMVGKNHKNVPFSKKKDKGLVKLFARKLSKAILVARRGQKNIARKITDNGISSSARTAYAYLKPYWRTHYLDTSSSLINSSSEETQIPYISLLQIQAATKSFSTGLVLTNCHQGLLFKGHINFEEVVVKQLLASQRKGYESFHNDILRSKINHLHVLPLIGFCTDYNRLYLVSKYMANRSLDYHL
ncbi:putative serine/threonine-protein kinase PBL22 [Apium graveolens]|uniref:putative serine/threonine-protein kinase PBL22 n=1 Tax=Apium graveolens TaxID=4045 RepID=UPI003D7BF1CC